MTDISNPRNERTFVEEVYSWFDQPVDPPDTLWARRLEAWLDTPNATVSAMRIAQDKNQADQLLGFARASTLTFRLSDSTDAVAAHYAFVSFLESLVTDLNSEGNDANG